MSLLDALYEWLGSRRVRTKAPAEFEQTTQVGKRAIALGLSMRPPADTPIAQVEHEESRLIKLYRALSAVVVDDDSSISRRIRRHLTRIVELTEDPRGAFARALQRWPERSQADREALLELAETLRSVADKGEQLLDLREEVVKLRRDLETLEGRYLNDLPSEWRRAVVEPRLYDVVSNAWSATAVAAITDDVHVVAGFLEARHSALGKELDALASALPSGSAPRTNGLEAEIVRNIALVRELTLGRLKAANIAVASSSSDHLAHLGRPLTIGPSGEVLTAKELQQRTARLREAGDARWSRHNSR
jgi:hypothetical protein